MNCLICGEEVLPILTLSDLLLWKRTEKQPICPACYRKLTPITGETCPQCGREQLNNEICSDCQQWEKEGLTIENHAYYHYDAGFRTWLLLLKGKREQRLAGLFQDQLEKMRKNYTGYTWVPIPSSMHNYQQRGFHQTACILYWSQITYLELLKPPTMTSKQALLTKQARLHNPRTFEVIDSLSIPNKILLFDDVYTTGSTLHQAATSLYHAGATDIRSLTLAR
ncbi:MAG: double zinc ribbon domain-containing protein [Aerococcus sp.]|nr:double zinc ribbon domain-containing protein [Aerococcus sp.]